MRARHIFPILLLMILGFLVHAEAAPYTPKVGSPERVAICDSLRDFMAREWVDGKLDKKMVFKIDWLKVSGDFAFISCMPIFEDGTEISSLNLPPIDYAFLLQKGPKGWQVIADFSGSDVPEPSWWEKTKRGFPKGVPADIFPDFQRRNLGM